MRILVPAGLLAVALLSGCSGGKAGDNANRGPFETTLISTGLGQIYPYRIRQVDAQGNPTNTIVNISRIEDLTSNVNANNGVLPVATFPTTAQLPNGSPGYQFLMVRFSHKLNPESILSPLPSLQGSSGLTGALSVLQYDPITESTTVVKGRGFVAGKTFLDDLATPVLDLKLVQAVSRSGNSLAVNDARVAGFPRGFAGDQDLVDDHVFVFVPDADGVLQVSPPEMFPANQVIQIKITSAVQDNEGHGAVTEVCTASSVGPDTSPPQIIGFSRPNGPYEIAPGNGDRNVDPRTTVLVRFNKPVQPRDVGAFFSTTDKTPPLRGISLQVTLAANTFNVIYYADPVSAGNLCDYVVTPAYTLPGTATVNVGVNTTINGLNSVGVGTQVTTAFETGTGPGIVNAPVSPEAIYVGIGGSTPGVGVIDLNGFGQGTGDINDTNFVNNPNLGRPGMIPNLSPGTSNMDSGGHGAMTLTTDNQGNIRLLAAPIVGQVGEIQIGQPLDKVFNNENINPNVTRANQTNAGTGTTMTGNVINTAPHPNPPKLVFPPPNPGQNIFGEEPTVTTSGPPFRTGVIMTTHPPAGPCQLMPQNFLVRGNPFGGPSPGLLWANFPGVFYGAQPPPPSPQPPTPYCPFTSRQQIGHFLYVLDRGNRQVLVLNSNRFTVIETLREGLTDPTSMAISPNLKLLAVANFSSGTITFIDIDPASINFHRMRTQTRVGAGPVGLAWQPEMEDLLVVNKVENSMTIVGGADLKVRKTVRGLINNPIDVAVTWRQTVGGFRTGIYFAYILNGNGTVAIFESGPDGVNGIGFDDVVGVPTGLSFRRARAITPDIKSAVSACWIAHEDEGGLGQLSHLELTTSQAGPIPITPVSGGFILPPTFRQRDWTVTGRVGGQSATTPVKDRLSGNAPVDVAFDELENLGGLAALPSSQISNLTYAQHSDKGHFRPVPGGAVPAVTPRYAFIALADAGKLDIFELDTGTRVRTLTIPGIASVSSYWRQ